MFDMHFDLLTLAYMTKKQGKEELRKVLANFNQNNVTGLSANLYFMSHEEMTEELKYPENINVLEMFKEAKKALEQYQNLTRVNTLYSIEGCDYISSHNDLDSLYKAGLDAILLVWNTENKYGSGNRNPEKGITSEGRAFIQHAIDLGIGIDLSHANQPTFTGIIEEIESALEDGKDPICYASHSNIRSLQDHPRNLTDEQIERLKEVNGKLGLVGYPPFLTSETEPEKVKESYMRHIEYATEKMGVDSVMVSSDNMDWIKPFDPENGSAPALYPYSEMAELLHNDLSKHFSEDEVHKISSGNATKIYSKIKSHR